MHLLEQLDISLCPSPNDSQTLAASRPIKFSREYLLRAMACWLLVVSIHRYAIVHLMNSDSLGARITLSIENTGISNFALLYLHISLCQNISKNERRDTRYGQDPQGLMF